MSSEKKLQQYNMDQEAATMDKPITLRTVHGFPVKQRPRLRELSNASQREIDEWFAENEITIGVVADTPERPCAAKRLLYTWKDCFAKTMRDIKPTDLIHHSINLTADAKPVYQSVKRYSPKEREFAARIFLEMEDAGIIVKAASNWEAQSQFPPKKKGFDQLRVVHNFIPVNKFTIKPQYPMHRIDEVIDTIIKPKIRVFFITDASNGYWAVPIKQGDEYKARFITPHGQYIYWRIGQSLKGACATYLQFGDLTFGSLPKVKAVPVMPTVIGDHGDTAFYLFMDDYMRAAISFEAMVEFLHTSYFSQAAFGPVYLSGHKTNVFADSLEMVEFTESLEGLRPAVKHRERAMNWKVPTNCKELDAIIWITPFLRVFIPGRAEHVIRLKKAYFWEEQVDLGHNEGGDATKSVRLKWVEKDTFDWEPEQQKSFDHIKKSIFENAMSGIDESLQMNLATDALKYGLGRVLFQLPGEPPRTEAIEKHKHIFRMVMFMSFKLEDEETRYHTTEREAFAVVRCMAEVKCFIMGHLYATMLYSNHQALESIMRLGTDAHGRIARWMDRLTEYDYIIKHRPCKTTIMGLADQMSQMPGKYSQLAVAEDAERMAMMLSHPQQRRSTLPIQRTHTRYRESRWYDPVLSFLLDEPETLKGLGKNKAKNIKQTSF